MTTDVMRFTRNKILIGLDTGIEWATPLGTVQLLDIGTGVKVIIKDEPADLYEEHYFNSGIYAMKYLNKRINEIYK